MKFYLVGGSIRDKFLGLDIRDRDWVVVGGSYKKMINLGFISIKSSFPVFIHPISNEEYALARKEKKNGKGYNGFICNFSKKITLKDDLYRRDLTINAIAYDVNENIYYDPYDGINDINNRIIKHISKYFSDDPLRVLRLAKIYSFYYKFGFYVYKKTFKLIKNIVNSGELLNLTYERIWLETKKVILKGNLFLYFYLLNKCNALKIIYPELINIFKFKRILYNFNLIFDNLNNNKLDIRINLLILFCFFRYSIISKNFFNNKKILNDVLFFCNRFNLSKKQFLLFKYIYYIFKKIFKYKKKNKYYIFLYILNILDVWRKPLILKIFLKFIKIINFVFLKNKILFILNKYLYNMYYICNNIKNKYLIKMGYKGIYISKKLNLLRYKKIFFYMKNIFFKKFH